MESETLLQALYTGKIIKNDLNVFERGDNFLQTSILNFSFR